MGLNILCPYGEQDPICGKCVKCHAINPPAPSPERRVCQRTRQWPGCPRYKEAWRLSVTPFREGYVVKKEETIEPTNGIGGVTMSTGLPMEPALTPEPPCQFLVYKESSCATCGGYICTAAEDRRIMDTMLDTCMKEPGECAIHNKEVIT